MWSTLGKVSTTITALMLGDVIGQSGARAVFSQLKGLVKKHDADIVVLNVENAADGFGVSPEIAGTFFEAGVSVMTTGNHIWQKKEVFRLLNDEPRILRPANYPPGNPGHGSCIVEVRGTKVAVMNLQGRKRLATIDCPFRKAKEMLPAIQKETRVILLDFHAEATEEKEALALYLDGEISVQVGTHTHIATDDARILPNGTAYITDLGSCGPRDSVIGFDPEVSVRRSLTQMPLKNEVSANPATIHGVAVQIDAETGTAQSIQRVEVFSLV